MSTLHIYYRISDKSNVKEKRYDKAECLWNFLNTLEPSEKNREYEKIIFNIDFDNCNTDVIKSHKKSILSMLSDNIFDINYEETNLGNSASFINIYSEVLKNISNHLEDDFYFVEDDYIHRNRWVKALKEGLEFSDLISLYDHPDKYSMPMYKDLLAKLVRTESSIWRSTPSTTMTFAAKGKVIKEMGQLPISFCNTPNPRDHEMFLALGKRGFSLYTPIPYFATHTEVQWLSPYFPIYPVIGQAYCP